MHGKMTQRAGVLSELPVLLCDLGADTADVFDDSGVNPTTLGPETRVPFDAMLKILDRASRKTGCEHLGLLIGLRFTFAIHGPIGRLMLTAPTLREALIDFVSWQPGYSSGAIVYLNPLGDEYALGFGTFAASMPGSQILYDAVIGVGARMVHDLTNGAVTPVEVQFSHRAPSDVSSYARLLKVPMRFNQHRSCLILGAEALQTPLPRFDPEKRKRTLAEIQRAVFTDPQSWSTRTRRALRHVLCTDKPTVSAVASEMGLHRRTLERRLADEGQTFEALRDEVRFAVARELLELTDIPIGEIGAILGFASPSVFTDAFRRMSGMPPSVWREEKTGCSQRKPA
ncbi:AraC family transcriptional regulator [Limibaculum sp. FT325]|uniref:AraC family transcriptional regulator n=1 Tax=Thermohalobaculum sediminis TaxID=2939436 RepID=UPI0020BF2584|nr:AraC family transcriptional regulator [Limibaculum sediminis]MCL5779160.1 AraC family transcriptional regulator [Limibaculum sediminis]